MLVVPYFFTILIAIFLDDFTQMYDFEIKEMCLQMNHIPRT